jgi:hypothetical protein
MRLLEVSRFFPSCAVLDFDWIVAPVLARSHRSRRPTSFDSRKSRTPRSILRDKQTLC